MSWAAIVAGQSHSGYTAIKQRRALANRYDKHAITVPTCPFTLW